MYNPGKYRHSNIDPEVPESLDGVLNSLETLLEHRSHEVPEAVQEAMESFADSMGEQYDDPLVPEDNFSPSLEPAQVDIPVLRDIIHQGDAVVPTQAESRTSADLDALLDALRSELDHLVDDILDDARERFSQGLENAPSQDPLSFADNINDFMRSALARREHKK